MKTPNYVKTSLGTQKGFIPVLLILLGLVIIGGGVYFYKSASLTDEVIDSPEDISKVLTSSQKEIPKEEKLKTYNSLKHGYSFLYDEKTEIKAIDSSSDPTACLSIKKGYGYILVNSKAQIPCGITGVGIDMIRTIQEITIDGDKYSAAGFVSKNNRSVSNFSVDINNKTSITFGVKSDNDMVNLTNEEYSKAIEDVKKILSSLNFVDEAVACTMDAMQCPDGSYVGRSGPDCEFVCPK
jgi:hypothetical protein